MQQLVFVGKGKLEWQEVAEPRLQDSRDVIVRPFIVARCDLDTGILAGATWFRGPFPFGHEFIAEVVEVGAEVVHFPKGSRVIVPFQISCGSCLRCQRGLSGSCLTVGHNTRGGVHYGLGRESREWGGGLSDLVRVPFADHMLIPIPEGIPPLHIASASDNLPDAWRTVGPYLQENPNRSVLIVGGGAVSIGIYAVAIAKALGAPQIDYIDTDPERLRLAEMAGARVIEGLPDKPGDYGLTVDASTNGDGLRYALRSTEPEGICTSVGIYFKPEALPLFEMYLKGVRFQTGRVNAREAIPSVLGLVQAGTFAPEKFTTRQANWEDAPEAFLERTTKVVVWRGN